MESKNNSDHKHIVGECISLANAAFKKGELLEATTRFAQARLLIRQAGISDCVELRHCLKTLAEIYDKRGKPEEGLEIIGALRQLDDTIEHRRAYVNLLYDIACAYEKKGDRERAEEAYGEALVEATDLLPANDPLIGRINAACIEIFKRSFKSKKLTVSDTQLRLARLPVDEPFAEPSEADSQAQGVRRPVSSKAVSAASDNGVQAQPGARRMRAILNSSVLSVGLSLLLIVSLIKAALFVPAVQSANREISVIAKIQRQQFESGDKRATFLVLDKHLCAIKKQQYSAQCHYTVIDKQWQDLSTMLRGCLTGDELWYQVHENTVIDPDKTVLYPTNAHKLAVVEQAKSGDSRVPKRVFIYARSEQEAAIRDFRSFSCTLVWIWAILGGLGCAASFRLKQSFSVRTACTFLSLMAFCALACWYLLAYAND